MWGGLAVPAFAANNAVTVTNPGGSHCHIVNHHAGAGIGNAAAKVSASHGQSAVTMAVVHDGSC